MRLRLITTGLVGIICAIFGFMLAIVLQSALGHAVGGGVAGQSKPNKTAELSATKKAVPKRKILYWWDSMVGASSISPKPGISSMGMPLKPVYAPSSESNNPGQVHVDPAMVQNMGIQTGLVTLGALTRRVRTVGTLQVAAPKRVAITVRADGWIGKLFATTNGQIIRRGQPLFTLYSPKIVAAEQELVAAQKMVSMAGKGADRQAIGQARELVRSVSMRLKFLGVNQVTIQRVLKTLKPEVYVTFTSPANGILAEIKVQQKSPITAGMTVMRVDDLSTLWLNTYVYENQLPWIAMKQRVVASIAAFPGKQFTGRIIFIDPLENPENHTITVRVALDNSDGMLRPGMFALVDVLTSPLKHTILVPRRAVINTGTGELVFIETSHGHFDPVKVTTGLVGAHGLVQVISGLGPGQKVVTSGQFMIDVESQYSQLKARFLPKATAAKPVVGTTLAPKISK